MSCGHIDYPCCGCGPDILTDEHAMEQDIDALAELDREIDIDEIESGIEHDINTLDARRREAAYDDMQDFEDRYCPEEPYTE